MNQSLVSAIAAVLVPNVSYLVLGVAVAVMLFIGFSQTKDRPTRLLGTVWAGIAIVAMLGGYLLVGVAAERKAAAVVSMLRRPDVTVTVYSPTFDRNVAIAAPRVVVPDTLFGRPVAYDYAGRDSTIWLSRTEAEAIARLWAIHAPHTAAVAALSR